MTINNTFNNTVDIFRYSSVLYEGEIDEVDIEQNPYDEALIRVTLGAVNTGTLYLNGSTIETLTFTASKYAESTELFTTLTGVTPTTLADGTMTIETVNEQGEPVQNLNFVEQVWGSFQMKDNKQYLRASGMQDDFTAQLFVGGDVNIETGDKVSVDDSVYYSVLSCASIAGLGGISHKEIILK